MNALAASCPVAVIGCGAMGIGIAQVAARSGHEVKLYDSRPDAAANAIAAIRRQLGALVNKGKMDPAAASATCSRLSAVARLDELSEAGLIIEAIVEDIETKRALFIELEKHANAECLFASNTSSISVTAIAACLQRPERLVGMHFFNPAPVMPLVEIVSGLATDRQAAEALHATARAWGKTPVSVQSTPGFIVNRIARPYYLEALRLLHERVADSVTLDTIMREAGGFRMGPFELMDLIGLDINLAVTTSVWQACHCDPRYMPSPIQQELVAAGWLGRKSGRGFYDYRQDAPRTPPRTEPPHDIPTDIALCGNGPVAAALGARLDARGIAYRANRDHEDGRVAMAGGAVIHVTDGRSATRRATETGMPDTVVIDLALDYTATPCLAIAVAESCIGEAGAAAVGLLQAAGIQVFRLKDAPGLPVMRTLAMLANEAYDAVNQGIAASEGIDIAMRLGANYPRGPLEWAMTIGLATIRTVLRNLGDGYGEDRYRVSPLIEQHYFAARGQPRHANWPAADTQSPR